MGYISIQINKAKDSADTGASYHIERKTIPKNAKRHVHIYTFGKKNTILAVLHMDEHTSHIHATVVPIVTGERRNAKKKQADGKRLYHKKPTPCCCMPMTYRHVRSWSPTMTVTQKQWINTVCNIVCATRKHGRPPLLDITEI